MNTKEIFHYLNREEEFKIPSGSFPKLNEIITGIKPEPSEELGSDLLRSGSILESNLKDNSDEIEAANEEDI